MRNSTHMEEYMRILVIGAGVLGCNIANDFFKAKKDVTLLARGKWAKTLRENGLTIRNKLLFRKTVHIPIVEHLSPTDEYDIIFVVMKYTQLDDIIETLNANGTRNIVLVGNNPKASAYERMLPGKNVLFGFASCAGHRTNKEVVSFDMKKITIGPAQGSSNTDWRELVSSTFADTGYNVTYEPDMEDFLLCHAAYVLPIVFACYKTNGKLRKVLHNAPYLNKIVQANVEGYSAIEKAGRSIKPDADKNYKTQQYHDMCMRFLKLMCATFLGKICASDHALNAVDEMSALNRDMKVFFDAAGVSYPTWKELEKDLFEYESHSEMPGNQKR